MTHTPHPERNHPVTTAQAGRRQTPPVPHAVTAEDDKKARADTADLERIDRLLTTVLVVLGFGGLIFTAVNVTLFAIEHDTHPGIAWMLDPLVSLALLGVLFVDGKLAAHGYKPSGWPFALRWFAGLATWLMNCWGSLYPKGEFTGWPDRADPAGLLLHSVIPFLVILLAEAGAGYRKFSTRRKGEYAATIQAWKDQENARREAEAEAVRRRQETAEATAEAERQRTAELAAEKERAAISAAAAREAEAAKLREIEATAEMNARLAREAREDEEARHRREVEARERQAELDRRTALHQAELERERIRAEAEADAVKTRAAAEAKALEDAARDRRNAAEARRARTAEPAPEATAEPVRRTAEPAARATAEPRKLAPVPDRSSADADDVRGAEAKRRQIEAANIEAAVLLFTDQAPTRREFGERYGRSEAWARERFTEAERLMAQDTDFEARVLTEADRRTTNKEDQVSA